MGEANEPLSATTWWFVVSEFVHLTVSPKLIRTELGENPDFAILTSIAAAWAGAATARAVKAAARATSLRIWNPLSVCGYCYRRRPQVEDCFRGVKGRCGR